MCYLYVSIFQFYRFFFLLSVKSSGWHRRRLINITVFLWSFLFLWRNQLERLMNFSFQPKDRSRHNSSRQFFWVEKCFGFKVIDIIHDKKSFEHFRAVIITVDAIEQSKLACAQKSRCAKQGDLTKDFVYEKWSNHQELNNTNP